MDDQIELRHLRYFVAVAEELHFGRAALRLHLAQPPLSQQIRRLEELLGYPLFLRTSRSVRLTDAGAVYLERTRQTLRTTQRDIDEARNVARGEVGSLHVGFVGSAMLTVLPAAFRSYRETRPQVQLHLSESFTSKVASGLMEGSLDIGVLRDGDANDEFQMETIYSERFVAVVPAHHELAKEKSISPEAMRGSPFVFYPRTAGIRAFEKPLSICEAHGFRPEIVQVATHWLTILRLIGAGLGVSIAPACVEQIASPDTICIPLRGTDIVSNIEVASRKGEARSMVREFTEMARRSGTR